MELTDNQIEKISRLIQLRKKLKLSQIEMAKKIGLTQSKLSEIESKKAGKDILYDIFYRLNFEFGISKEWWENGFGPMILEKNQENLILREGEKQYGGGEEYWRGRYDQIREDYEKLLKELGKHLK